MSDGSAKIVRSDYGWDFYNQTGYNFPWSFPDKGVYGFNEIDGEVLMPSGFQMPSQKPRNFERTGEVLDVFAAGTQLWMDIQGGVGQAPWPAMADWPPQPASPHTADYHRPPSTLRTLPEWLAEDYAAGRQPGRLDPFNVDVSGASGASGAIGGTAIIGGTRSSKTHSSAATGSDAPDVPDWYAYSTDAAHFTPDLPATQPARLIVPKYSALRISASAVNRPSGAFRSSSATLLCDPPLRPLRRGLRPPRTPLHFARAGGRVGRGGRDAAGGAGGEGAGERVGRVGRVGLTGKSSGSTNT